MGPGRPPGQMTGIRSWTVPLTQVRNLAQWQCNVGSNGLSSANRRGPGPRRSSECASALMPPPTASVSPHFGCSVRGELGPGPWAGNPAERRALRADEALPPTIGTVVKRGSGVVLVAANPRAAPAGRPPLPFKLEPVGTETPHASQDRPFRWHRRHSDRPSWRKVASAGCAQSDAGTPRPRLSRSP
jgi:hypothetical protein